MRRSRPNIWRRLARSADGAVAPTIALALFALIAIGGVGFDYARMASMDTELQNAADQAALAAASQLDGQAGACERAVAAARSLVANQTLMANDAGGLAVTIVDPGVCDGDTGITFNADASIRFYQDIGKATPSDDDENAKFVEVEVSPRTANFALTPIVAAMSSGPLTAKAFAGLGEAICNTPPVMMCNPSEPNTNTDPDYPFTASPGDGIRLVIGSATAPGNFGFLQTGFGTGAQDLARALGYNTPPADCAPTNGVDTEPGVKESVRAAFNTRFDISQSGLTCPNGGACSPSINARKDLVKGNNCGTSGNQGWQESANPYRPSSPTTPLSSNYPDIMGHPRDLCHAVSVDGACETDGNAATVGDIIGDGAWDRDAYFRVNYGWNDEAAWTSNTGLSADATRYQVYVWEIAHPEEGFNGDSEPQPAGTMNGYARPVCRAPGVTPGPTTPDRRSFPVAVINCVAQGLGGRESGVQVITWMDVFLVEPAFRRENGNRTDDGDIYVEVIGETNTASTGTLQVVKKAVPYLIE